MLKSAFEAWSREARRLRDEALSAYDSAAAEEARQCITEKLEKELNKL